MTLKLGGDYQRTDVDLKTSTREAQKYFLKLVLSETPEVVKDLLKPCNFDVLPKDACSIDMENLWLRFFLLHTKSERYYLTKVTEIDCHPDFRNTPFLAYFDHFHKHKAIFDTCKKNVEMQLKQFKHTHFYDEQVRYFAIKAFIPSWKDLRNGFSSDWLCTELLAWADRWKLNEEWCLDFALECLANIKVDYIDTFHPPEDYLRRGVIPLRFTRLWSEGLAWNNVMYKKNLEGNRRDFEENTSLSEGTARKLVFQFLWPSSLSIDRQEAFEIREPYFPNMDLAGFIKSVDEQFWRKFFENFSENWTFCTGKTVEIADGIKQFDNEVKHFVETVRETIAGQSNLEKTVSKDSDRHFRWLIDYQIKGLSQNKIAGNANVDRRAVKEGIEDVSDLIGLQLRPLLKGGRPIDSRTIVRGAGRVG